MNPDAAPPIPDLGWRSAPHYWRFLINRLTGGAANQMLMVALGWQMYDLTGRAWDLGMVGLAQFLPILLLTLPAGHLVDRHDRRRLLALSLAVQGVVAVVLATGSLSGWVSPTVVLVLSVLLGAGRALQMPSQQALLPGLVPAAALPRAMATSSSVMQASIIGGPAAGGALYAWGARWGEGAVDGAGVAAVAHTGTAEAAGATVAQTAAHAAAAAQYGAALVYGVALLLLAVAIAAVLTIRPGATPVRRPSAGWKDVTAGLHYIRQRPVMLGAISLDLFAVLLGGATALLPIFARDILHVGPEGLGLLRAAPAFGAVLTGLALARWPLERRAGRWLLTAVAIYGVSMIGFGLATSFALAFAALLVSGAADMISVVIRQTLVQLETPDDMRGRVGAVNTVFIGASNQLGEFESGVTAAALGPVGSVLLGGFGTLAVVALWWRIFPDLARRDRLVVEGRPAAA